MRLSSILIVACMALCAAPAQACMEHRAYPTFWSGPPVELKPGEVVLRVRLKAETDVDTGSNFTTTCDGGSYIFDVVEVLSGRFSGNEIAIVHPVIGSFVNAPAFGEARIVVGSILPPQAFTDRIVLDPNPNRLPLPGSDLVVDYLPRTIGGPSIVPVLKVRIPPAGQLQKWIIAFALVVTLPASAAIDR